jgi:hypothetical protein
MRPRDLFLNAALAAIAWTPSLSQSNPPSTPRFGIIGGANLATLTGNFLANPSNRTGFTGGLIAVLPVSPSFAIQPELMFTMKGTNGNSLTCQQTVSPRSTICQTTAGTRIDYIELPVLARFEIPASGRVKPFVYGGPGFAYRTHCTLGGVLSFVNADGTTSQEATSVDCDSSAREIAVAFPGTKYSSTDVDGIIGGGLSFDVGGRTMTLGVRYDVGFVKLYTYGDSKNRVLSFMGTFEWPFRK